MTGVVEMTVTTQNFEMVQGKLHRFPKKVDMGVRKGLGDYFEKDFKPMLNKVLKGFKVAGLPAMNSGAWVNIKASTLGINHSLGVHSNSRMHPEVMAVKPQIHTAGNNKTTLKADYSRIPSGGFPYLKVVHEGGDSLHQAYQFIEASRKTTDKKLLRRLDMEVSNTWNKA